VIAEPTHLRGDVWLVDFGVQPEDPEQALRRPAVIVSDDRLHHSALRMAIVVPGTRTLRGLSLHIEVPPDEQNGLRATTAFQIEQVRSVSSARLVERLGRLGAEPRHAIDEILRAALSLS